jgi:hypothetical protein
MAPPSVPQLPDRGPEGQATIVDQLSPGGPGLARPRIPDTCEIARAGQVICCRGLPMARHIVLQMSRCRRANGQRRGGRVGVTPRAGLESVDHGDGADNGADRTDLSQSTSWTAPAG